MKRDRKGSCGRKLLFEDQGDEPKLCDFDTIMSRGQGGEFKFPGLVSPAHPGFSGIEIGQSDGRAWNRRLFRTADDSGNSYGLGGSGGSGRLPRVQSRSKEQKSRGEKSEMKAAMKGTGWIGDRHSQVQLSVGRRNSKEMFPRRFHSRIQGIEQLELEEWALVVRARSTSTGLERPPLQPSRSGPDLREKTGAIGWAAASRSSMNRRPGEK